MPWVKRKEQTDDLVMCLDGGEVVGRGRREGHCSSKAERRAPISAAEHVHRDPEQVSGRILEHPDAVPLLEHANERILGDLLGLVAVTGYQAERREQGPGRGLVELLEAGCRFAHVGLPGRFRGQGSQVRLHRAP